MRYYIRNQALRSTLDDLIKHKDQETMRVFKEVMLYRCPTTRHSKKHAAVIRGVKDMLLMPRIVILGTINIVLTALCLMILPYALLYMPNPSVDGIFVMLLLYMFLLFELARLIVTLRSSDQYILYVLIDELISRKVIQLVPHPKSAKAIQSHKNRKANVVD